MDDSNKNWFRFWVIQMLIVDLNWDFLFERNEIRTSLIMGILTFRGIDKFTFDVILFIFFRFSPTSNSTNILSFQLNSNEIIEES